MSPTGIEGGCQWKPGEPQLSVEVAIVCCELKVEHDSEETARHPRRGLNRVKDHESQRMRKQGWELINVRRETSGLGALQQGQVSDKLTGGRCGANVPCTVTVWNICG